MSDPRELQRLLEQYRQIVASARNRQSREAWAATRSIVLDKWRGCPRPVAETGRAPICVWLGSQFLIEMLGTDLSRYYREPMYFLEHWLKTKTGQRAKYLDEPVAKGETIDDDVSVPLISPAIYQQFIFPADRLADC